MGKFRPIKPKSSLPKQRGTEKSSGSSEAPQKPLSEASAETTKRNSLPYFIVFALGFLLYANTIPFDYALDDKIYITANSFTKKGFDGIAEIWTNDLMTGFFGSKKNLVEGGRYRPLALTTHAIEWAIFKENPAISHFVNVVLYGLTGVVLLMVLQRVFGWKEDRWWWNVPFIATVLFIAHPLHTEVTANIKSRDEIMSLLFALLAFLSVLKYLDSNKPQDMLLSGLWFLASLFSKESSVTFLGLIPLTLLFFPKAGIKKSVLALTPLLAFTVLYLLVRLSVFADQGASLDVAAELMNKPYLNATAAERYASIFFTMALYLKLLIWPHPLTHDYYPYHPFRTYEALLAGERPYVDWSSGMAILGLLAYCLILLYGFWGIYKRLNKGTSDIVAYGGLVYFGTFILFSNLFFDIGSFMNERFLYIPSLGFTIVAAHVLVNKVGSSKNVQLAYGLVAIMLLGFSFKTIARNYAWENDFALASADVETSSGSAKVKMTMGSEMLDLARESQDPNLKMEYLRTGERYSLQSLQLYPEYFPPLDILGNLYFEMARYDLSVQYFVRAVQRRPSDTRILNNLEIVANQAVEKGAYPAAVQGYQVLAQVLRGKDRSRVFAAMGELYGKNLNDLNQSKKFLNKALKADPNNAGAYQKIGVVFAMTQQNDSAMFAFTKSLSLEPENARVHLNLGILYNQLGDPIKGSQYIQKAYALDPTLAQGGR